MGEVKRYLIRRAPEPPPLNGAWGGGAWRRAETLEVGWFHPSSSAHRPRTEARLLFDDRFLYVSFRVRDRYVRAVSTRFQDPVYRDSCAELFVQPRPEAGYFNFEMSCGGTMLLDYIEDPRRTAEGFARYRPVERRHLEGMQIYHSLPQVVEPEITGPVTWRLQYRVPLSLFAAYLGSRPATSGASWRGNLYKCGDGTSHPHWAAWSPLAGELEFHQPAGFGLLQFA
jgi:hypothetical protein